MREHIIAIGRDSRWYLASTISAALIGFIAIPILSRIFTPGEYGVYALVTTTILLASPLLHVWLSASVIRFYPEYEKKGELDVLYSTVFHFMPHFLLFTAVVLLPLAAFVLPLGGNRLIICLGILTTAMLSVFFVCLSILRVRQMSWQYSVLTVFVQFSRYLAGAAIAVWLNAGVAGPFWGWLCALLIAVPIELIMLAIWKHFDWKKYSPGLLKELFTFGFVLVVALFFAEILSAADRYMIQGFKGAFQVGLYSLVYALVTQVEGLMAGFLKLAAMPVVIKVYEREGEEKAVALITRITRYFLILLAPTVVALYALRQPIIQVIAPMEYYSAVTVILPLVLGLFLNNIAWVPNFAFYLKKRTMLVLIPLGSAAAINVLLNSILIPKYGFAGAAWATFISYAISFTIVTVISRRLMRWEFPWISACKIGVSCCVMWLGLLGLLKLKLHGWLGLSIMILAGAALFLLTLFAMRDFSKLEIEFVMGLLVRIPVIGKIIDWVKGAR